MHEQEETKAVKAPAEVRAELLEHLRAEFAEAQANYDRNMREGFPDAAASWLPALAKWQRMISYVEQVVIAADFGDQQPSC